MSVRKKNDDVFSSQPYDLKNYTGPSAMAIALNAGCKFYSSINRGRNDQDS